MRACVLLLTCLALHLPAAEPPHDKSDPINLVPGQLWDPDPVSLDLTHQGYRPMVLRKPTQFFESRGRYKNLNGFLISSSPDEQETLFTIQSIYAQNTKNYANLPICFDQTYNVESNQIFPIYNELYHVTNFYKGQAFRLTRITEKVPEQFHPADSAKTLTLNAPKNPFTYSKTANALGYVILQRISALPNELGYQAEFRVIPPPAAPVNIYAAPPPEKSHQVTLKVGDTLECGQQKSKLVKIVPPGPLDPKDASKGKLVGWVEFEPEVIRHP